MTQTCRHGLSIAEPCRECDLATALETVRRLGPVVDEAREVIAEAKEEEVSNAT